MSKITRPKQVHHKSKSHEVAELAPFTYQVTSGTSGQSYVVRVQHNVERGAITYVGATCSCRWGQYRSNRDGGRSGCSHVQAVFAHIERDETGRTTAAWGSTDDARRQHRPILALGDGVYMTTRVGT